MFRPDPFNELDGRGNGTVDVLGRGRVDKNYNLWDRKPRTVTAAQLDAAKVPGKGGYDGPSY